MACGMSPNPPMPASTGISGVGIIKLIINMAIIFSQEFNQVWRYHWMIKEAGKAGIGIYDPRDWAVELVLELFGLVTI